MGHTGPVTGSLCFSPIDDIVDCFDMEKTRSTVITGLRITVLLFPGDWAIASFTNYGFQKLNYYTNIVAN